MTIMTNSPKTTFIHIPKTAGTSISQWLLARGGRWQFQNTPGGKHAPISLIREVHPGDLGFTFVSIRNPWDRLVSGYFFYRQRRKLQDLTFQQFVLSEDWHQLNRPQAEYFEPKDVQAIIRFENLHEDFEQIKHVFKAKKSLGKHNPSSHNNYKSYYTNNEMIERVAKRHAADIQRFGYKFE